MGIPPPPPLDVRVLTVPDPFRNPLIRDISFPTISTSHINLPQVKFTHSGEQRKRAQSARKSVEVLAKRSKKGTLDLFRLQEIESSDVTLPNQFVCGDVSKLYLAFCEFSQ